MNHKNQPLVCDPVRLDRPNLLRDERGLSSVEYVILLVLLAAACVGLWVSLGGTIQEKITAANDEIKDNVLIGEGANGQGSGDDTGL